MEAKYPVIWSVDTAEGEGSTASNAKFGEVYGIKISSNTVNGEREDAKKCYTLSRLK